MINVIYDLFYKPLILGLPDLRISEFAPRTSVSPHRQWWPPASRRRNILRSEIDVFWTQKIWAFNHFAPALLFCLFFVQCYLFLFICCSILFHVSKDAVCHSFFYIHPFLRSSNLCPNHPMAPPLSCLATAPQKSLKHPIRTPGLTANDNKGFRHSDIPFLKANKDKHLCFNGHRPVEDSAQIVLAWIHWLASLGAHSYAMPPSQLGRQYFTVALLDNTTMLILPKKSWTMSICVLCSG